MPQEKKLPLTKHAIMDHFMQKTINPVFVQIIIRSFFVRVMTPIGRFDKTDLILNVASTTDG